MVVICNYQTSMAVSAKAPHVRCQQGEELMNLQHFAIFAMKNCSSDTPFVHLRRSY